MKVKQLVDRFGSNRMNAAGPARHLQGCTHVTVPFAGGMSEIPFFKANVIVVADTDRHVINLANIVKTRRPELVALCDATLFHPDELKHAQDTMRRWEQARVSWEELDDLGLITEASRLEWAHAYYLCSWMARGGAGGTRGEFEQGLSIRWKSGGGDSVVRFRNAVEGLAEWQAIAKVCTFVVLDCFETLTECQGRDEAKNGIYCDPPWPEDGDTYKHRFTEANQRGLADVLTAFEQTRIVVRYGDHPLIRELYPETLWQWHLLDSRTQANKAKREALIVRKRGK